MTAKTEDIQLFVWHQDDEVLRITLQTDHMAQAGDVGVVWGNGVLSPPRNRVAVVTAARNHDEGWRKYEFAPDMDEHGLPVDYKGTDRRKHAGFYGRGVDFVEPINPHSALLISMHATGLYLGRYGVDGLKIPDRDDLPPHSLEFVRGEEERQGRLQGMLQLSDEDKWHDYRLLQIWDRISIVCCDGLNEATVGPAPTDDGGKGEPIRLRRIDELIIEIDPFPFDGDDYSLPVRSFQLPKRKYPSWDAVNEVFCATAATVSWFRLVPQRRAR